MYDLPDVIELDRGMPALALAQAFMDQLIPAEASEDRERFTTTILCAGQHISEVSGPGDWEAFDAEIWSKQMVASSDREYAGFFFDISSFFGWMATSELMTATSVVAILKELERLGPPCDARSKLAATTIELLSSVASA